MKSDPDGLLDGNNVGEMLDSSNVGFTVGCETLSELVVGLQVG